MITVKPPVKGLLESFEYHTGYSILVRLSGSSDKVALIVLKKSFLWFHFRVKSLVIVQTYLDLNRYIGEYVAFDKWGME